MILGALFGFIYALRVKETYARIINWTMIVAIAITFAQVPQLKVDGYYLFAMSMLGVIVYGASGDFTNAKKIVLISCGLLSVIPLGVFLSMTLPYNEIALLTGIIQLGVFGYALKTDIQSYKEEMGFLVILAADALIRVIGGGIAVAIIYFL